MNLATLHLGALHIVESLQSKDLKTGARLRQQLAAIAASHPKPLPVHFWTAQTREEFLGRLKQIEDDVRTTGRPPIVHLETHGDRSGLFVTSGETVTWADLKGPLTNINITARLNLLVVVAACHGEALLSVLQAYDRAPVWGMIGPNRPVYDTEIDQANAAFYGTLHSTVDGAVAVRAMRAATGGERSPFGFYSAQWFFREVMRGYYRDHCSEEGIRRRVEKMVASAEKQFARDGKPEALPLFAAQIERNLRDFDAVFKAARRQFFTEDLCPEHAMRFQVSLTECQLSD